MGGLRIVVPLLSNLQESSEYSRVVLVLGLCFLVLSGMASGDRTFTPLSTYLIRLLPTSDSHRSSREWSKERAW